MGRPKGSKNKPKPKPTPEEQLKNTPKLIKTSSAIRTGTNEGKYKKMQGGWKKPGKAMQSDEIHAIIELGRKGLEHWNEGIPKEYPPTQEGFELFVAKTSAYFNYIEEVNMSLGDGEASLIPNLESWCLFCGITRNKLYQFVERKDHRWAEYIDEVKNIFTATINQMSYTGKMPSVIAMFEKVNNYGYHNTSEYKITSRTETEKPQLTAEQLIEKSKLLPGFSAETSLLEDSKRIPNDIFDRPIIDGEYVPIDEPENRERGKDE